MVAVLFINIINTRGLELNTIINVPLDLHTLPASLGHEQMRNPLIKQNPSGK